MKRTKIFLISLLIISSTVFAQSDDFVPNGKPVLRIFSNAHTTITDGNSASEFELLRVYLGYEHNFSKNLYAKANLDIGNPGVGKHQMAAYVKNAYLRYRTNNFNVEFGMISTTQFKVQESAWGYRYLEKSFQDEYKFNSSADLGVSAAYKISKMLSVDVIIANGEGYKKIEADSTLRTGFGLTINPVKNFTGRVYYDFSSDINTQSSIATFLGYTNERISLGAEYMKQLNPGFTADRELNGLSFYSTVYAAPRLKFFARYDNLYSNTVSGETVDWNLLEDGQNFIAGLEFSPAKGVKLAPNFKGWSPADNSQAFVSTIILNCEVKF
jgi:hypothetical protein